MFRGDGKCLLEMEYAVWTWFEGVCVNYRNPSPRRGEPRVGSAPDVAFPLDPVDPVDLVQNPVRLSNTVFYNDFCTFCWKMITIFGGLSSQTPFFTMILAHFARK